MGEQQACLQDCDQPLAPHGRCLVLKQAQICAYLFARLNGQKNGFPLQ
jgi:hypothetical protein